MNPNFKNERLQEKTTALCPRKQPNSENIMSEDEGHWTISESPVGHLKMKQFIFDW